MKKKIFNSDKSRMRPDLTFNYNYWILPSAHIRRIYFIGFIMDYVDYADIKLKYGVMPVCTI